MYVGVGWCLCRAKLVTEANSAALTNLLLYVVIPCVIVQSFYREASPETTLELLMSLGLSALAVGLAMAVSFLVFRKRPAANFGSSFSNAGFMGIPLITAVVGGKRGVLHCRICGFAEHSSVDLRPGHPGRLQRGAEALGPGKEPPDFSLFCGLLLYFLPITLPSLVENAIGAIAGCNAPVAMVVLGVLLGNISPRKMFFSGEAWAVSGVRLLLIPLLTALVLKIFPSVPTDMKSAILIAAAAPVGSNLALYVQRQKGDAQAAAGIVCLSTILSIVTMPLIMLLVR